MKLLTVYKILPAVIIYKKIAKPFVGKAHAMVVFIDPNYIGDKGLLEHELVHVKQFYRFPFHGLLYKFNSWYRLKCEVEAYKKQLEFNPANSDIFAGYISERYGLKISRKEVLLLLEE